MVAAAAGGRSRGVSPRRQRRGSDSGPWEKQSIKFVEGSNAGPLHGTVVAAELTRPRRRRRVTDLNDHDTVVIAPPRIEVCTEEQWQTAIDLLADLLASAFQQGRDDGKAA